MKKLLIIIVMVLFVFSGLVLNAEAKKVVKKDVKEKKLIKKDINNATVYVKTKDIKLKAKGKKYHKKNCKIVKEGKKGIKLSVALKKGYTACAMCKPVTKFKKKILKKKILKKEVDK